MVHTRLFLINHPHYYVKNKNKKVFIIELNVRVNTNLKHEPNIISKITNAIMNFS
uniref:Uncharacterized protein n=1 Tax=Rhizophora mucronata TaxID=61149 RepID=A0A2P2KBU6_RHIMU